MRIITKLMQGVAAAVLLLPVGVLPAYAADGPNEHAPQVRDNGICWSDSVAVAPAEGQPTSWDVAVTYCRPFGWMAGEHQLDVLTHGATYTHTYWDWPQDPALYSYVDKTLADGRAVVAYDRIGNGNSTRPASSTEITMATDAYVLHQLIQAYKTGEFKQVNSISHSYGSGVAVAEAATYHDVDRVMVSGYLHRPSNPAVTAGNYPANQDPKFASLGLDNGWLTSRPGVRGTSFHSPTSDPAVIAYDEIQKDLVSLTGLLNFLGQRNTAAASNLSNQITVPVLVINGQQDAIFCYQPAVFDCSDIPAVTANEAPYYTAAPSLTVTTVPDSGHDLTLHPSANASYATINQWIQTH